MRIKKSVFTVIMLSWLVAGCSADGAESITVPGGDIFEVEPSAPYPTGYTDCDLKNASALDSDYQPDAFDEVPVSACAVGMIYSFYGRLSVSMNNVATLRAAKLPPAFYCWGTRDGSAGQFGQNSQAVESAGCTVQTHILQNYPHGYGTGEAHRCGATCSMLSLRPSCSVIPQVSAW